MGKAWTGVLLVVVGCLAVGAPAQNSPQTLLPLTVGGKFEYFANDLFGPGHLAARAAEAAVLKHGTNGFCDYGAGLNHYGRCLGAEEISAGINGSVKFGVDALLRADPRYARLGHGTLKRRIGYSLSQVFLIRTDRGGTAFNFGNVAGILTQSGLDNLYCARSERGWRHSFARVGTGMGTSALFQLLGEFWPDVAHGVLHRALPGQ